MLEYFVHSCAEVEARVEVEVAGRGTLPALTPGLVVELVQCEDDDQGHGDPHGHTFRLTPRTPKELERQRTLFTPGNRLRLHFTQVKEEGR